MSEKQKKQVDKEFEEMMEKAKRGIIDDREDSEPRYDHLKDLIDKKD